MARETKQLKITQIKSGIGYARRTKDTLRALGIRRMHQTVVKPDNPAVRGMIVRVRHLVKVEEE
jgi:large subunit ribosomal protein L30